MRDQIGTRKIADKWMQSHRIGGMAVMAATIATMLVFMII